MPATPLRVYWALNSGRLRRLRLRLSLCWLQTSCWNSNETEGKKFNKVNISSVVWSKQSVGVILLFLSIIWSLPVTESGSLTVIERRYRDFWRFSSGKSSVGLSQMIKIWQADANFSASFFLLTPLYYPAHHSYALLKRSRCRQCWSPAALSMRLQPLCFWLHTRLLLAKPRWPYGDAINYYE